MNIDSIIWPTDKEEAIRLYLDYLLKVINAAQLGFSPDRVNPISTAKEYMSGAISETEYKNAAKVWWDYLDATSSVRDLHNHDALMARIAIALLSVGADEADNLGEHLSWFLELMQFLGVDLTMPLSFLTEHFRFREASK